MKKHKSNETVKTTPSSSTAEVFVLPPELLAKLGINLENVPNSEVQPQESCLPQDSGQVTKNYPHCVLESKDTSSIIETANLMKESVFLSPTFHQSYSNVMPTEEQIILNESVTPCDTISNHNTSYSLNTNEIHVTLDEVHHKPASQSITDHVVRNPNPVLSANSLNNSTPSDLIKEYDVENQDYNLILTDVCSKAWDAQKNNNKTITDFPVDEHTDEAYLSDCSNSHSPESSNTEMIKQNLKNKIKRKKEQLIENQSDLIELQELLSPTIVNTTILEKAVYNDSIDSINERQSETVSSKKVITEKPLIISSDSTVETDNLSITLSNSDHSGEVHLEISPKHVTYCEVLNKKNNKVKTDIIGLEVQNDFRGRNSTEPSNLQMVNIGIKPVLKNSDCPQSILNSEGLSESKNKTNNFDEADCDNSLSNVKTVTRDNVLNHNFQYQSNEGCNRNKYSNSSGKCTINQNNISDEVKNINEDKQIQKNSKTENYFQDEKTPLYYGPSINEINTSLSRNDSNNDNILSMAKVDTIKSKLCIHGVEKPGGTSTQEDSMMCVDKNILKTYKRTTLRKQFPVLITKSHEVMLSDTFQMLYMDDHGNSNIRDLIKQNKFCICYDFGRLSYYDCEMLYEHIHFCNQKSVKCGQEVIFSIYNDAYNITKQIIEFIEDDHQYQHDENNMLSQDYICWNEMISANINKSVKLATSDPQISEEVCSSNEQKGFIQTEMAKEKAEGNKTKKIEIRKRSSIAVDQITHGEPSTKKEFKCGVCNQIISDAEWETHKVIVHDSAAWKAGEEIDLKNHNLMESLQQKLKEDRFLKCSICFKEIKYLVPFIEHMKKCVRLKVEHSSTSLDPSISNAMTLKSPWSSNSKTHSPLVPVRNHSNSGALKTIIASISKDSLQINIGIDGSPTIEKTCAKESSKCTIKSRSRKDGRLSKILNEIDLPTTSKKAFTNIDTDSYLRTVGSPSKPGNNDKITGKSADAAKNQASASKLSNFENTDSPMTVETSVNTDEKSSEFDANNMSSYKNSKSSKSFKIDKDKSGTEKSCTLTITSGKLSQKKPTNLQNTVASNALKRTLDIENKSKVQLIKSLAGSGTIAQNSRSGRGESLKSSSPSTNMIEQSLLSLKSTKGEDCTPDSNPAPTYAKQKFSNTEIAEDGIAMSKSGELETASKNSNDSFPGEVNSNSSFENSLMPLKDCIIMSTLTRLCKGKPPNKSFKTSPLSLTNNVSLTKSINIFSNKLTGILSKNVSSTGIADKSKQLDESCEQLNLQLSKETPEALAALNNVTMKTDNDKQTSCAATEKVDETNPIKNNSNACFDLCGSGKESSMEKILAAAFNLADNVTGDLSEPANAAEKAKNDLIISKESSTDPLFITKSSGNLSKCGVCSKNVEEAQWIDHISKEHNYLAWRDGEPILDLDDSEAVKLHLQTIIKQKEGLVCSKCGLIRKLAKTFLRHVRQCNENEKKAMDISTASVDFDSTQEPDDDSPLSSVKSRHSRRRKSSIHPSVCCGVCNKSVEHGAWIEHIRVEHNYLAWKQDESPLNVNDEALVKSHLNTISKQYGGLLCNKCNSKWSYVKKYLVHLKICNSKRDDSTTSADVNSVQESDNDNSLSKDKLKKNRQRKSGNQLPVCCGVCSKTVEHSEWIEHIRVEHKYLAWKNGDTPLDLNDEAQVKSHLNSISKQAGGLECSKCYAKWSYVKKYLVHEKICDPSLIKEIPNDVLIEVEIQPVMTCGVCKVNVEGEEWFKHIQQKHEYMAWIDGETPLDMEDSEQITEHLKKIRNTIGELTCNNCGVSRKYVQSYEQHVRACKNTGFTLKIAKSEGLDENEFECGVCHEKGERSDWKEHVMTKHYNIGWMVGELPINLRNPYAVEKYLKEYRRHFSLTCKHCKATRASCYGFYAHIMTCGKSDAELEAVHDECSICNNKYLCIYKNQHVAMHREQEIKKEMRLIKVQKMAEEAEKIQEELVNQQPMGKRRAARKAKKVIEKYAKNAVTNPVCGCGATFDNLEQLSEHQCLQKLQNDDDEILDVSVKIERESDVESIYSDTESNASADEEQQQKKKRVRVGEGSTKVPRINYRVTNYLSYLVNGFKDFCKLHFTSDSLFTKWRASERVLVPQEDMENYMPPMAESCKLRFDGPDREWMTYKRFESRKIQGYSLFTGAAIQCISWAPHNLADETLGNYLAVSTHRSTDVPRVGKEELLVHPGLIQIWDFKQFNFVPKCALGLAHDYGIVWGMDWCPSGGRDLLRNGCNNEDVPNFRLGLLSIACSNGSAYILAVPYPQETDNIAPVMYKLKPVAELKLSMSESRRIYQATSINWSQQKGHDIIVVGYSDGTTALYDLNTESRYLKETDYNHTIYYPFQDKLAENSPITGVGLWATANESYCLGGQCSTSITGGTMSSWPAAAPSVRSHLPISSCFYSPLWPAVLLAGDALFTYKSVTELEWWGGGRRLGAARAGAGCMRCGRVVAAAAPFVRLLRAHPCYPEVKKQIVATLTMVPIAQKRKRKVNDDISMVVEPHTYDEAVTKYGLEMRMVTKKTQMEAQKVCMENELGPDQFPLSDIVSVAFCPSARYHEKLALATHSGLIFVINS